MEQLGSDDAACVPWGKHLFMSIIQRKFSSRSQHFFFFFTRDQKKNTFTGFVRNYNGMKSSYRQILWLARVKHNVLSSVKLAVMTLTSKHSFNIQSSSLFSLTFRGKMCGKNSYCTNNSDCVSLKVESHKSGWISLTSKKKERR